MSKTDIRTREDIERFVGAFYERLLADAELGPIFVDVARVDLAVHQPLIVSYWEKLLLGGRDYQRHTMNIHRAVHAKRVLGAEDFERWLGYYRATMDSLFQGPTAERAKKIAASIANNMQITMRS